MKEVNMSKTRTSVTDNRVTEIIGSTPFDDVYRTLTTKITSREPRLRRPLLLQTPREKLSLQNWGMAIMN